MDQPRGYKKIMAHGPRLRLAFQDCLGGLAEILLNIHLISSDNVTEINVAAVPSTQRASRMLELLRNKVKLTPEDDSNYNLFVEALQKHSPTYDGILKILGESHGTVRPPRVEPPVNENGNGQLHSTQSTANTNGATNQIGESSMPAANRQQTAERPRFTNVDMREVLQSNKPQNEPQHLRAEIENYISKVVVLLHTVKEEELVAVYKYLKPPIGGFVYTFKCHVTREASLILGKFGNHDAAVVQTEKSIDCADGIRKALKSLPNVQLVIGVGFAYGNKEKCKFGDVLVSKFIYDVTSTRLENEHIKLEGGRMSINMNRVIDIFARGALDHRFESVTADPPGRKSKILADTIISGANLVNNERYVREILKHDARSIGGEMEGNTVAKCVLSFCEENQGRKIDFIIIKGVADYGDGTKGKPWQYTASVAAVNYAECRLEKAGKVYCLDEPDSSDDQDSEVEYYEPFYRRYCRLL